MTYYRMQYEGPRQGPRSVEGSDVKAKRKIISVGVSADQLSEVCFHRNSIVRFHPEADSEYFPSDTAIFIGLRYNDRLRTMFFDFIDPDNPYSDIITYNHLLSETAWEIEVLPEENRDALSDTHKE